MTEPQPARAGDLSLDTADPQEAAYKALHAERAALEEELTLLQQRQRFGQDEEEIEAARVTEAALLKDLDRVLTMIRAAEIRRQQPQARRWQ
ncbi:hypothetical protein [Methylorubrum zatmanii]|uniref:Uncharacterized protein n=1 Tax=Methylorubrum zatmanii TaxID=29429 RepID=A0ABW1WMM8_9HYPH|nr:hypothetical protein [Methylorubrum zatmanii]